LRLRGFSLPSRSPAPSSRASSRWRNRAAISSPRPSGWTWRASWRSEEDSVDTSRTGP